MLCDCLLGFCKIYVYCIYDVLRLCVCLLLLKMCIHIPHTERFNEPLSGHRLWLNYILPRYSSSMSDTLPTTVRPACGCSPAAAANPSGVMVAAFRAATPPVGMATGIDSVGQTISWCIKIRHEHGTPRRRSRKQPILPCVSCDKMLAVSAAGDASPRF